MCLSEILVFLDELDFLLFLELDQVVHLYNRLADRILIQDIDDSLGRVLSTRLRRHLVENLQLLLLVKQKSRLVAGRSQRI